MQYFQIKKLHVDHAFYSALCYKFVFLASKDGDDGISLSCCSCWWCWYTQQVWPYVSVAAAQIKLKKIEIIYYTWLSQLSGHIPLLARSGAEFVLRLIAVLNELNGFLHLYKAISIHVYFPKPQC